MRHDACGSVIHVKSRKFCLKGRRKDDLDGKIGLKGGHIVDLDVKIGLKGRQKVDLDGKIGLGGRRQVGRGLPMRESPEKPGKLGTEFRSPTGNLVFDIYIYT